MTSTIVTAGTEPLFKTLGKAFESPEGGRLVAREAKGELFMAAVTTTAGDTYYENEEARDGRIRQLTRDISRQDPGWLLRLVRWARDEANVRRIPMVITQELVKARLDRRTDDKVSPQGLGLSRVAINVACVRADEPSRMLEYWEATYGRPFPKPLKRGLADAVQRLYTERSALKYDTDALRYRFGDVLEIVHAKPRDNRQADLFEWLLNFRHGRKDETFTSLPMINANTSSREKAKEDLAAERARLLLDPNELSKAGMTWENLSGMGEMDAAAWEAMIPSMGFMAVMRNLRNLDKAGISAATRQLVIDKLVDPDEVERSRQFPFRFLSAYMNSSKVWHSALETALNLSCRRVPELPGRTLQLVDCSGSMWMVERDPSRAQKAGVFAGAIAKRGEDVETWAYGSLGAEKRLDAATKDVLALANGLQGLGGTDTAKVLRKVWNERGPFDRVIILTDEQIARGGDPGKQIPQETMMFTFNIAGYRGAQTRATKTRHSIGGLTDQGFSVIPAIEAGTKYDWPF